MIVVTGASGQLGRLVVEQLLKTVAPKEIVAAVRDPAKVAELASRGVQVRHADYSKPETLAAALAGAERLLLISGNDMGQRSVQHRAVIDAARKAQVKLVAYTSILHADKSTLELAKEHLETEIAIAASKIPHVLLRNGWYNENYWGSIQSGVKNGALLGCSGEGRFSTASRADYAAAAAAALTRDGQAGKIYELAGDSAFSLTELAAEIAKQSGTPVVYKNLSEAEYKQTLLGFKLPEPIAGLLSDSDAGAARGELFDNSKQLSTLIGHATTPIRDTVQAALKA